MGAQEYIKILLVKEGMTITDLAKQISLKLNKNLSRSSLSNKLRNNTLRFDELIAICDVLNYELTFNKK